MPCSSTSEPWIGLGHEMAMSISGMIPLSIAGCMHSGVGYDSGVVSSCAGLCVLCACSGTSTLSRSTECVAPSGMSSPQAGGTC